MRGLLSWAKTALLILTLIFVGVWITTRRGSRSPLVQLQLPLKHNLLVEPLDSEQMALLRLYAVPYRALVDSLAGACESYRRDSAALFGAHLRRGAGQAWQDRWHDMDAALARRVEDVRRALVMDSAAVSPEGLATIRLPPGSLLLLGSRAGILAEARYDRSRTLGDQLAPIEALCRQ